ncbi:DUF1818 family protein [Waterburya agarophytonicola K14]|uniref:DUF1818 family protein n=1 Tax=Waterburya agarophytonicola KI4 TaxID=2874699 RepID=A0A964C1D2_9CYAN|nr:DUF1818 family protein [Waterburya agarophytonicola]MCC0179750.1 DUF1818 family protein [Waterburya agarophytonicola KI4]
MERLTKSGAGWRIGWHPHGVKYQGLIGGEDWAIELTKAELNDFCRLLNQLVDTMSQMSAELMDEEKINCEAETDLLWMEVEGYCRSYSLRLILNCDRRCEGNWQEGVAPQIALGFDSIGFLYENN